MNNVQSSIIGGKSGGKRRVLFGKGVLSLPLRHEPFALPCRVHALYRRSERSSRRLVQGKAQVHGGVSTALFELNLITTSSLRAPKGRSNLKSNQHSARHRPATPRCSNTRKRNNCTRRGSRVLAPYMRQRALYRSGTAATGTGARPLPPATT